jgi:hypothetical protein
LFDENLKNDSYHVGHQLRLKYQKENPFASLPVTIRPFLRPGAFFSQTDFLVPAVSSKWPSHVRVVSFLFFLLIFHGSLLESCGQLGIQLGIQP